jgi:hypothetical protein
MRLTSATRKPNRQATTKLVLGLVALSGCASEPTPPAEYPPLEAPAATAATEPQPAAAQPAPPPEPPAAPVQVVAAESTPIEGAMPTFKIRTPREGQLIKTETVEVKFDLKNWALSPDGNHVHLIVDNEPYIAIRDAQKPIELRALVQKERAQDLTEGTHVLRMFPSRPHHESVKDAGAFDVKVFHFKKKSEGFSFDPKAPLLTYSRPKGCSVLGSRVLLDFYVSGTQLSAAGHRVRVTIDDATTTDIVSWTPHYIENLPEGEHRLRLQLLDAQGQPVAGLFNDTTKTIQVAKDCSTQTPAWLTTPEVKTAPPPPGTPMNGGPPIAPSTEKKP